MCPQIVHDKLLCLRTDAAVRLDAIQQIVCSDIGGHNQDCILKVNGSALRIRNPSVIQHLQKHIKYVRMRLFDFIKQDNTVRLSSDCLGQLSALFISHISGRRSDKSGHRIFLHVLTHINPHHIVLIIKKCCCQRFCKLCFTYTGRS